MGISAGANKAGWKFTARSVDGGVIIPLSLSNIGNVGIGIDDPYTKLHVNGKLTVNTNQVAPPSYDTSGGIGDRTISWNGTSSSDPFSLGTDNRSLWYSVPSGSSHEFYVNNSVSVSINSIGLGIGIDTPLYPLYVSDSANNSNTLVKRHILTTSNGISSTTNNFLVIANFNGSIWCSNGTIYVSSDARIKNKI
jgi:hypothetical protein